MADLRITLRQRIERISNPWLDVQPAWLGDLDGVVTTSLPGMYNARLINAKVVQVYNYARVPADWDLPVKIGRHKDSPTVWQIIEGRQAWTVPAAANRVEYHREQHQEGGADQLALDRKQIIQLSVRVQNAAGFVVRVYGGLVGNVRIDTQSVDLSSYVITVGAKIVAIESDTTSGALSVHEGSVYESPEIAAASDLPVPATGKATRAYVLLYAGQASLADGDIVVPWPADGITDAASLTYTPADANDWDYLTDPGDTADGLDQLAARVTDLEATPPGTWDGDITDLDETSSADIGEAIADNDQGIIYNTSAAAWMRFAWSRVKTYIQALTDTLYLAIGADYSDISANDADTDVTGAELEELTDGSETTLHSHAGGDGWTPGSGSWSYASADDPTFTLTVNADVTGAIGVGDRIKLTQTTAKYFIVTAISYSAPNTTITLYGGTDYDLANAAISNPYYSHAKSPLGFPTSLAKWTVTVTDSSNRTQSTPTQNTWYNLGSISIDIPIGVWKVAYKVALRGEVAAATAANCFGTLSTANNSESDGGFTTAVQVAGASGAVVVQNVVYTSKTLTLAAKTTYYLNSRTTIASQAAIANRNNVVGLIITAECTYL